MKTQIKKIVRGSLMLGLMLVIAAPSMAEEFPVEHFFRDPEFSQLQLSPNGRYIAALAPFNKRRNIVVMETGNLRKAHAVTGLTKYDVRSFFWANDDRIVFTFDKEGEEAFGLYAVGRDGGKVQTLVEPEVSWGARSIRYAEVVDRLRDDPEHIAISYNKRRVKVPDLYRLNVDTGKRTLIAKNQGNSVNSVLDRAGNVRVDVELDGTTYIMRYRDDNEQAWRELAKADALEEGVSPAAFDYDNETLYVASNIGRDRSAIYKYDLEKNGLGEMLFAHDAVDVTEPIFSYAKRKLIGFAYATDKPQVSFIDPEWAALQAGLDQAFPGDVARVTSVSDDERLAVVTVYSDRAPGRYYLYTKETGEVRFLVSAMGWIDADDMVEMKPIRYTARDGLEIHGYLTLPKGYAGTPVPLIVNPHGGPWVRDEWGFNQEHQFFANRGYATLQVNFRGSTGYGHKFARAGDRQWGLKMQDDISDAVQWAIAQGFADPRRVCIYGASYGGYATMVGLTSTPELYRCGINYVGVTDMALFFETMPEHWALSRGLMEARIGDPDDEAFMKRISPLSHVEKIQVPVFIVHGKRDPRVDIRHAEKLRDRLDDLGKPYEWLVKNKEGHGFSKEENRIELYEKMDAFLKKHL